MGVQIPGAKSPRGSSACSFLVLSFWRRWFWRGSRIFSTFMFMWSQFDIRKSARPVFQVGGYCMCGRNLTGLIGNYSSTTCVSLSLSLSLVWFTEYRITRLVFLSEHVFTIEKGLSLFNAIPTKYALLSEHKTQLFSPFPLLHAASTTLLITLPSSLPSALTLFSVLSYQKDERSLAGSLQNRKLFLIPPFNNNNTTTTTTNNNNNNNNNNNKSTHQSMYWRMKISNCTGIAAYLRTKKYF